MGKKPKKPLRPPTGRITAEAVGGHVVFHGAPSRETVPQGSCPLDKALALVEAATQSVHRTPMRYVPFPLVKSRPSPYDGAIVEGCIATLLTDHGTSSAIVWQWIAERMQAHQVTHIGNQRYGMRDCFVEALRRDRTLVASWIGLGHVLRQPEDTVKLHGETITGQKCCQRAIDLGLNCAGWVRLSQIIQAMGTFVIAKGRRWTQRDAALEAIAACATDTDAWCAAFYVTPIMGTLATTAGCVTKRECASRAIEADPSNGVAWTMLGTLLRRQDIVTAAGKRCTRLECFTEAAVRDPTMTTWLALHYAMAEDDVVRLDGATHSKADCKVLALEAMHCPGQSTAAPPAQLPHHFYPTTSPHYAPVTLRPPLEASKPKAPKQELRVVTAKDAKPEEDPKAKQRRDLQAHRWLVASEQMHAPFDYRVAVGKAYSKRQCAIEALNIDSSSAAAWTALGSSLEIIPGATAVVEGKRHTAQQCHTAALATATGDPLRWVAAGSYLSRVRGRAAYASMAPVTVRLDI